MPSKRDVLALLTRDELLAVVDRFELPVADRRVKHQLIEAGTDGPRRMERPRARDRLTLLLPLRPRRRRRSTSVGERSGVRRYSKVRNGPSEPMATAFDASGE